MHAIPFGPLDKSHSPLLTWNPADGTNAGFLLIAGPCVIESLDLCLEIGATVKGIAQKLGVDSNQVLGQLAQHLPAAIDHMTPNGQVPAGEADLSALQSLAAKLGL